MLPRDVSPSRAPVALSGHPDFDRELDEAVSNWQGTLPPVNHTRCDPWGREEPARCRSRRREK